MLLLSFQILFTMAMLGWFVAMLSDYFESEFLCNIGIAMVIIPAVVFLVGCVGTTLYLVWRI